MFPLVISNFISRTSVVTNANYEEDNYIAGYANTTSAVDAVKFEMTSGNIDSGEIILFGVS